MMVTTVVRIMMTTMVVSTMIHMHMCIFMIMLLLVMMTIPIMPLGMVMVAMLRLIITIFSYTYDGTSDDGYGYGDGDVGGVDTCGVADYVAGFGYSADGSAVDDEVACVVEYYDDSDTHDDANDNVGMGDQNTGDDGYVGELW